MVFLTATRKPYLPCLACGKVVSATTTIDSPFYIRREGVAYHYFYLRPHKDAYRNLCFGTAEAPSWTDAKGIPQEGGAATPEGYPSL